MLDLFFFAKNVERFEIFEAILKRGFNNVNDELCGFWIHY